MCPGWFGGAEYLFIAAANLACANRFLSKHVSSTRVHGVVLRQIHSLRGEDHGGAWSAVPSVLVRAMKSRATEAAADASPPWWEAAHRRLVCSRAAAVAVSSAERQTREACRPGAQPTESAVCPPVASLVRRQELFDDSCADPARWTKILEGRPVQVPPEH